jgi:ubiquinone/menaquinone biosynthesis C-methylase UbiE
MSQEAWNANAREWSRRTQLGTDLSRKYVLIPEFIRRFEEMGRNDVLDAGSGAADVGSILQRRYGARVVAIDYSIEMCRQAVARLSAVKGVICGDVSRLPFSDHSFDTIVANMVLGSVRDLEGCCSEFSRVLRPRGILIFSILHPARVAPASASERTPTGATASLPESVIAVNDYFHERTVQATLKLGGSGWLPRSVEYFHRPLSRYADTLFHNNLVTLNLYEPFVARQVLDEHPEMATFWSLAPFLVWAARKELSPSDSWVGPGNP